MPPLVRACVRERVLRLSPRASADARCVCSSVFAATKHSSKASCTCARACCTWGAVHTQRDDFVLAKGEEHLIQLHRKQRRVQCQRLRAWRGRRRRLREAEEDGQVRGKWRAGLVGCKVVCKDFVRVSLQCVNNLVHVNKRYWGLGLRVWGLGLRVSFRVPTF